MKRREHRRWRGFHVTCSIRRPIENRSADESPNGSVGTLLVPGRKSVFSDSNLDLITPYTQSLNVPVSLRYDYKYVGLELPLIPVSRNAVSVAEVPIRCPMA